MRVVVTGAAGMIGANLVHGLNAIGVTANNRLFAAGRVERLTTSNDVAVVRLKVPACRR